MRSKITFILLALNLAVFGYLFVVQRHATAGRVLEENRRRVLGPEAANLDRLQISFTLKTTSKHSIYKQSQTLRRHLILSRARSKLINKCNP
jgi:hypothetical protein